MSQKLSFFLFLFLCFSLNTFLNAQSQNDSLTKYSYEELRELYRNTENRRLIGVYVKRYLEKAKEDEDTIKIARGYYNMSIAYDTLKSKETSIKYLDSSIVVSYSSDNKTYPVLSLYNKGCFLYNLGNQKKALDIFFEALEVLKIKKNLSLELDTKNAILSIKDNWFSGEEKLKFIQKYLIFLSSLKDKSIDLRESYLSALFNLSASYIKSERYEDGLKTAIIGIKETIYTKDSLDYYYFVSLTGTAQYYLENYRKAIDSLQKALPYKSDHGKAMSNYYLGKSYDKLNQPEKAQFHFLKTDSIYQATKDIFPEMRIAYEHIIDYYKSKNDAENQIKYYDRLLEADKVIDSTYTYVTETIEKKYETPQAIAERARLVEELETKKNSWKYRFGAISLVLLVILGVLVAAFRRQKYYKRRFESLMNISTPLNVQKTNPEVTETSISMVSTEALEAREGKKDLGVPQEIIESILNQLQKFEASKKFTKQVSLTDLSKNLKTNPKYLSKVINWHYKKNFSHYISELRIEYVISKLKEDSKFRNYTIKAIAEEAGFGNTESFSKAFHKSTGIKPSYFIKELHKRFEG